MGSMSEVKTQTAVQCCTFCTFSTLYLFFLLFFLIPASCFLPDFLQHFYVVDSRVKDHRGNYGSCAKRLSQFRLTEAYTPKRTTIPNGIIQVYQYGFEKFDLVQLSACLQLCSCVCFCTCMCSQTIIVDMLSHFLQANIPEHLCPNAVSVSVLKFNASVCLLPVACSSSLWQASGLTVHTVWQIRSK